MKKNKVNWFPLFATQFLGVLNDNFLKYLIVFICALWFGKEDQANIISLSSAMLVIPYVLFSALAGKWAKIFSKRKIVVLAKFAEIPIMLLAIIGFFIENIWFVMFSMLLMGLQSAIYSPSKYGLIKDVGGVPNLSYGTGMMEMLTFIAVFLGSFFAGVVADITKNQFLILAFILLILAIFGYWSSLKIKVEEPPIEIDNKESIEPFSFIRASYLEAKKIIGINYSILGLGFFWLIGSMLQMNLIIHAKAVYQMNSTNTGLLMSILAIGIGIACWLAGVISKKRAEIGLFLFGGLGLSILMTCIAYLEFSQLTFTILLFFSAFFSGFFKIPLNTYIQEKVKGRLLGQILAYSNLVVFIFILFSAGIFGLLSQSFNSYFIFGTIAFFSWFITIFFLIKFPDIFLMSMRLAITFVAHIIFKIKVKGENNIPQEKGALLVSNHIGLLDSFLIISSMQRIPHFIIMKEMYYHPALHWLLKNLALIPVNERGRKSNLMYFYETCQDEIKNGKIVVIFAESMMSRIGHTLGYKRGLERISEETNLPIIPFYMDNAFGSPLSYITGTDRLVGFKFRNLRRKVSISIGTPISSKSTAFQMRQETLKIASETFSNRIEEEENLISFILKNKQKKRKNFISDDEQKISFNNLLKKAKKISLHLSKILKDEKNIAVYLPKGIAFIEANLIAHFLDKNLFILNPKFSKESLNLIIKENNINYVLTQKDFYNLGENKEKVFLDDFHQNFKFKVHKTDLASKSKTSISTIFYKKEKDKLIKIALTQENILSTLLSLKQIVIFSKRDVLFNINDAYNNYFTDVWFPLFFKINTVFTKKNILEQTKFSKFIKEKRVSLFVTNHNFIEKIFKNIDKEQTIFLKHIVSDKKLLSNEIKAFIKNDLEIFVTECLDILECSILATINTMNFFGKDVAGGKMKQYAIRENKVGRPLISNFVKVVNPDNFHEEMKENENGLILIKGDNVIKNYPDNPELNKERFFEDYFITNLIGNLNPEGFLELKV